MGLGVEVCKSPGGGSGDLDEGSSGSPAVGSPTTRGTLGSDGGSAGGSPLFPGEAVELPCGAMGSTVSAEATTGEGVGSLPGSLVFDAGAAGLGGDTGLAALAEDLVCSDIDVGFAGAATGSGVGDTSHAVGVKAIGGSKRSKVVNPLAPENIPVHANAHVRSRENISIGGMINGSQGGPIVRPADGLLPKPHVGQARSLTSSGDMPSSSSAPKSPISVGSDQGSPIMK